MLDFFRHKDWGKKLIDIIEEMMVEKKVLTPDMGGTATTKEVGDESCSIAGEIKNELPQLRQLIFYLHWRNASARSSRRSSLSSSPTENRSRVWVMPFSSASSGVRSAWVWVMG